MDFAPILHFKVICHHLRVHNVTSLRTRMNLIKFASAPAFLVANKVIHGGVFWGYHKKNVQHNVMKEQFIQ